MTRLERLIGDPSPQEDRGPLRAWLHCMGAEDAVDTCLPLRCMEALGDSMVKMSASWLAVEIQMSLRCRFTAWAKCLRVSMRLALSLLGANHVAPLDACPVGLIYLGCDCWAKPMRSSKVPGARACSRGTCVQQGSVCAAGDVRAAGDVQAAGRSASSRGRASSR